MLYQVEDKMLYLREYITSCIETLLLLAQHATNVRAMDGNGSTNLLARDKEQG